VTELPKSVAVIGGGVAGISAAVALADHGFQVELFEKRPLLGGRASSWFDHETGERHDACQHGTMRCCTNLADLLERLGVHDQIRYQDVLEFLDSDGRRSVIKGSRLPAPFHTALSFLTFRSLGLRDKIGIGRAMLAMLRTSPTESFLAKEDVAGWFKRMGQTERALRRFWEPILVSACNESMDRISCGHAFKLFREGFLCNATAFQFGIPRVPLGTLYTEPTVAYLQRRGGCVNLRTIVDQVVVSPDGARIEKLVLQDGTEVEADYYVSALQFDLLLKLLPPQVTGDIEYFDKLRQIEFSPIVGVHFWFDRHIECPEALALLDRDSDWIFNKNLNFDTGRGETTYLSVVISASREIAEMPKEQVQALVLEEVRACLPETRSANVVKSFVLKERKATFSPKPGIEALRPDQRSPISNLFVAGEWTDTGWPSTMEGAVRSGYKAAEYILADAGIDAKVVAPDLPITGLARLLTRT
jgi:squalene-associated FAD-dependent desaturase